jgi:hypothetical protein
MALVKYNNNSISAVTTAGQVATGSLVPIKTLTASSSATLSFVHGTDGVVLDSTYPIYKFEFINMHPATDGAEFQVGFRDGGTNYDAIKTTTGFLAIHTESDSETGLNDRSALDGQAQNTGFLNINLNLGNDNDQSLSGTMFLYNPSSTTFVKHFMTDVQYSQNTDGSINYRCAGYCNTTTAIDGVQFKMSSGNTDAGKIKLYGIKDS